MRKTTNLLIREGSKKSSRQNPQSNTTTSFKTKTSLDKKQTNQQLQFNKEMVKAETLSAQEQEEIQIEAKKTVNKKIKMSENKIQNDIVGMLESQCAKLGAELEKQKAENNKLRIEVERCRKNIQYLNEKLEKAYNDHTNVSKNQIDGKIENKQLLEELTSLKSTIKKKQSEIEHLKSQKLTSVDALQLQIETLKNTVNKLNANNKNLLEQKSQIQEQLQQKTRQAQLIRESFEERKKQWDSQKKQLELDLKSNIQRKGEKITKIQVDSQKIQDKLKQEENLRKKLIQKNKDLQKQLNLQIEKRKLQEEQNETLKKRVNDLSILKSSNNAIMNQKLSKITEENEKLKSEIEQVKTGKTQKSIEKPILFGSKDYD